MSTPAVDRPATFSTLVDSDPLNAPADASIRRLTAAFDLDAPIEPQAAAPEQAAPEQLTVASLEVIDAADTENLFGLSPATPQTAASAELASYYDPIEWGNPQTDQYYWRQQNGQASCAVVAQISVYQSLTGNYIDELTACNYAQSQGWFDPQGGTLPQHVGKILNVLGISTSTAYNATLNDLAIALSRGDKPIVGLDANEIWNPKRDQYGNPVEQANAGHAVWVTGIDQKANGSYNVILNDSGTRYGRSEVVSYQDFYNAWADYNRFVSIADNPFT